MPKFVIEREVPGAGDLTDSQLRELSQKSVAVLKAMGPKSNGSTATSQATKCTVSTSLRTKPPCRNTPNARASLQSRFRRAPDDRPLHRGVSGRAFRHR